MTVFLQDNFNDTNGTALTSHTVSGVGATGGSWAALTGNLQTGIIFGNRVESNNIVGGVSLYRNSATPGSADYSVTADVYPIAISGSGVQSGPLFRASSSAETFYDLLFSDSGTLQMWKSVAGSFTQISSTINASGGAVQGVTYHVTISGVGTTLTGYVKRSADAMWLTPSGTWQSTKVAAISLTDGSISAAGFAGIYISASQSSGMQASNIVAYTGTNSTTVAVNDANLFFSPYNWALSGSTFAEAVSPGAYLKFNFTGTSLDLNVDVTPLSGNGSSAGHYPYLRWSIDSGTYSANTQLLSTSTLVSLATDLVAGTHTAIIHVVALSNDDRWTVPEDVVRITGVVLDAGSATATQTVLSKRLIGYGDSITQGNLSVGVGSSPTADDGQIDWCAYVAAGLGAEYGILGYASQGYTVSGQGNVVPFYTPVNDGQSSWNKYFSGTSRLVSSLFSPAPDYIFIAHGQNDHAVSAATVAASVSAALTALRAAAPNAWLVVLIPFSGASRTGITNGFNTYQGTPDAKAKLVDVNTDAAFNLTSTPTYAAPNDGVHPNARMHAQLGAMIIQSVEAALATGGSSRARIVNAG